MKIKATGKHPFSVESGEDLDQRPVSECCAAEVPGPGVKGRWAAARDLRAGDILITRDGRRVPVTSLSCRLVPMKVYNLHVEGLNNYAVGRSGILVHNKNPASASRPLGARGPTSGREFDPAAAGAPIRQLTTNRIRITSRGVDVVEQHVARFGPDAANQEMIQRLRDFAAGRLQSTQAELNFYAQELREFVRYRRLGWRTGQPPGADAAYDLWNNAHAATLEEYGLREGPGVLYHPSVEP